MPNSKLPSDFVNPFAVEDPDKVWDEYRKISRHVSREEAFGILEKARRTQKKGNPRK